MKLIRKQAKKIAIMLSLSLMFVSCSQYDSPVSEVVKVNSEDLFKSIVFADGQFKNEIPALANFTVIDKMSSIELEKYRALQSDFVKYIKVKNPFYFENFKYAMSSKNPEIISNKLKSISADLIPWINEKLAIKGLSIEKLKKDVDLKKLGLKNFDINKGLPNNNPSSQALCAVAMAVLVWGVAVVAVGVVVIGLVYWTVTEPDGEGNEISKRNSLLDAISIQIAENV